MSSGSNTFESYTEFCSLSALSRTRDHVSDVICQFPGSRRRLNAHTAADSLWPSLGEFRSLLVLDVVLWKNGSTSPGSGSAGEQIRVTSVQFGGLAGSRADG